LTDEAETQAAPAGFVTKKAESLSGLAKANVAIYQEEDKIKKAEAELGRLYYSDYISGNEADAAAYQEICDRITASRVLVEGLRAEVSDLKAKDQGEIIVEEDEITDADFVIPALLLHKDSEELRQLCGFSDPCDAADSMFDVKIIKNREPDDISEDPDAIFSPDVRTKDMWVQKRLSWVYEAPDGDGLNKSGVTALSREDKQEGIPVPAFIDPTGVQAAARRGTAIHAVMSCLDKASLKGLNFYQTEDNIEAQLKGFIKSGALSQAEAGAISAKKLAAFFTCELGKDALSSGDILCEQPFNILFSNKELGADENDLDSTMLQGVIDMCFLKDGTWVIVDFKTGFVSNDKAKERYSAQVGIYAKAIKRLTGKNACGYIYLLDRSVSIPII